MKQILPLSQWLATSRADEIPIAWQGETIWTLGHFRHDVIQLFTQLRQRKEERWALCFENSYLFSVALLATLYAGKTPVIPGHSRPGLLQEQQALFHGVLGDKRLEWQGEQILVASRGSWATAQDNLPPLPPSCHIELFTSGSTGTPKQVVKSLACFEREAGMLARHFGTRLQGCRVVASVVPQHLYGLTFRIFLPLSLGLPLHADMIYYAEQLSALDARYRYVFVSSPAFLKRLDPGLSSPPIALLLSAGGVLPWYDAQQSRAWLGTWPDEIYGSTETGILAWRQRTEDLPGWTCFPGIRIVAQRAGFWAYSPLLDDVRGLMLDDTLQFTDDGCFHLTGRRGRVVKMEEKRISLSEVEKRLMMLPGVSEAAVVPIIREGRQRLGAVLVLTSSMRQCWQQDTRESISSWRDILRTWLDPIAVPRYWRVVEAIPVNSMNKRVHAQLQELFHEAP